MLKNYIKIAWRTLMHDKGFTALNLLSLTIGITFSLLLFYYVQDELSFDNYHEKGDRIYRINSTLIEPDKTDFAAITSYPMAPQLQKDIPEVEKAIRLRSGDSQTTLIYENTEGLVDLVYYADSSIFSVFTIPMISGNPTTALSAPNSIVLNKTTALKYFSTPEQAVGKSLKGEGNTFYEITGVMEDLPDKSHIYFNCLVSISTIRNQIEGPGAWGNFGAYTYVLLKPNSSVANLEKGLEQIYPNFQQSIFGQFNVRMEYSAINIEDIHLKSEANYEPLALGNMDYVYTFSTVAILLLIIACINYMNLTTARSARRAREIGIRKVSGSLKPQLIAQFITESMLLALFAFGISILLIILLLPTFNDLSGKSFTLLSLLDPQTFGITLLVVLVVGFIGGSYPAFFLSKFDPLIVLKGKLAKASSNAGLRKTLVVIQFTVSIAMLISTWMIFEQLNFLQSKDLGYDKENVMIVNLPFTEQRTPTTINSFKNRALSLPQISNVSTSVYTPNGSGRNYSLFEIETDEGFATQGLDYFSIDENFIPNFDIKMAEGRNFRLSDQPDSSSFIIVNQALVNHMNWGEDAIGKRIKNQFSDNLTYLTVIGVVKDFHMRTLYNPIEPLMLNYGHDNNSIQFKVSNDNVESTIASIERLFLEFFPGEVMSYTFADEDFRVQFEDDETRSTLFTTFSALTIVLAFLGLLGLIAYTTQQRKKEIAIRKVMGAESGQIVLLMTKNFISLVALASIIAFPLAYYFLSSWLETYTYSTSINPLIFAFSALVILGLTLLTVSYHSIKAAVGNHVNAMRIH